MQYVIVWDTTYIIGPFDSHEAAQRYIQSDPELFNANVEIVLLQKLWATASCI